MATVSRWLSLTLAVVLAVGAVGSGPTAAARRLRNRGAA